MANKLIKSNVYTNDNGCWLIHFLIYITFYNKVKSGIITE